MLTIALATLRHQSRRLLAPLLAVALGVGFLAATSTFAASAKASMTTHAAGSFTDLDLVAVAKGVTPGSAAGADSAGMPADLPDRLRQVTGVEDIHAARAAFAEGVAGGRSTLLMLHSPPHPASDVELTEGRWPQRSGEATVSTMLARSAGLSVGEDLAVGERRLTVVGVADGSGDTRYVGLPTTFVVPGDVADIGERTGWDEIDLTVAKGADLTSVRDAVAAAAGPDVTVRTGPQTADAVVADLGRSTDMLGLMLRAFGLIALVVTAMVIGNTFAILLARRQRETAMLRAVGASRRQVVRSALVEGSVLGVVGGLLGAVGGALLATLLVVALDSSGAVGMPMTPSVGWVEIVLPVLAGLVAVLVAVLRPALAASRVSPLEAMRPAAADDRARRTSRLRTALGVLALLAGLAALGAGAATGSLALAMAGGAVSFAGVVALAPVVVPAVAGLIGRVVARPTGLAGQIAAENVRRNPGRSAATAMALLVGVTLVTMTTTAAATAQRSVTAQIDESYPVDGVVATSSGALPEDAVSELRDVRAVEQVSVLSGGPAEVAGRTIPVVAADDELTAVVRDGSVEGVTPGTIRLPEERAEALDLAAGDVVTAGDRRLTVAVGPVPAPGGMVAAADLPSLVGSPQPRSALVRLDADVAADEASTQVAEALQDHPEVSWTSSAQQREELEDSLAIALAVVLGMLAMSVLIAVVGIANTLSLSVHERARESALMRALGVSRRELRRVVGVEAVLMALTGTVLGTALGVAYGLGGASALLGDSVPVVPALPWWQIALVALVAAGAGLVASVLPAARAAQVSPAAALAAD